MRLTKHFVESDLDRISWPSYDSSYTPIAHSYIVEMLREEGDKNNIILSNLKMIGNQTGTKLLGTMDVTRKDSDYGMRVAFRNSYDKSMPFGLALGAVVFACSNSVIAGEVNYKRKHIGEALIETKGYISEGMKSLGEYYEKLVSDMERLKQFYVDAIQASQLLGRMFMLEDIISSMQLNIVKEELYNSKHFNHLDSDAFSAFDFYQAITESLKKSHPTSYIANHSNLHNFMLDNF
jgi:hypothetical protein